MCSFHVFLQKVLPCSFCSTTQHHDAYPRNAMVEAVIRCCILHDYFHHHHVAWLINCWCLPVRSFFLVWKVRYIIVFEVQDVYPILFDVHQPSPKSGPIQWRRLGPAPEACSRSALIPTPTSPLQHGHHAATLHCTTKVDLCQAWMTIWLPLLGEMIQSD